MLNKNIGLAAKRLREAEKKGIPCEPIRNLIGDTDIATAYFIQQENNQRRIKKGAKVVGHKIGLTSPAVQKQLGVDQPDFGLLFHDKEVLNNGEIEFSELMQPKIEAEIAFVLGKDLKGKIFTTTDIISAIDYALISIEIVGSRVENWDIRITDTIADNASASHFVVGHRPVKLENLDLIKGKMVLKKNGKKASSGLGGACLGSPINAMLWLANTMAHLGTPMKAGQVILSGALGPMVAIKAGDDIVASYDGLGEVAVKFI